MKCAFKYILIKIVNFSRLKSFQRILISDINQLFGNCGFGDCFLDQLFLFIAIKLILSLQHILFGLLVIFLKTYIYNALG